MTQDEAQQLIIEIKRRVHEKTGSDWQNIVSFSDLEKIIKGFAVQRDLELLPCPFCGTKASHILTWVGSDEYIEPHKRIIPPPEDEMHIVRCNNFYPCNAAVGWFKTKQEAIEAWNKHNDD